MSRINEELAYMTLGEGIYISKAQFERLMGIRSISKKIVSVTPEVDRRGDFVVVEEYTDIEPRRFPAEKIGEQHYIYNAGGYKCECYKGRYRTLRKI